MNNNVNTISENLLGILIKLLFITNIRMKVIGELLKEIIFLRIIQP